MGWELGNGVGRGRNCEENEISDEQKLIEKSERMASQSVRGGVGVFNNA